VNCVYIDYDVEASNGGLTPSIRRSTAISSIDGKASKHFAAARLFTRGAASFAPLATLLRYLVGEASFLVLDHAHLRGDAQHASIDREYLLPRSGSPAEDCKISRLLWERAWADAVTQVSDCSS